MKTVKSICHELVFAVKENWHGFGEEWPYCVLFLCIIGFLFWLWELKLSGYFG